MNNTNKPDNRKKIYNYILNNPGVHQIEISRATNISPSTVNYHLYYLTKQGLLTKQKEDRYLRYYVSEKISNFEKKVLNTLRQETPCDIILYLIIETCASQTEISKSLEKHPSTIDFHLKKLVKMGIIERMYPENGKVIIPRLKKSKIMEYDPVSNDAVYKLKNLEELCNLLFNYKKSFSKNSKIMAAMNLIKYAKKRKYLEIIPNKTYKNPKNITFVDSAIEHIEEVFPNPYHI